MADAFVDKSGLSPASNPTQESAREPRLRVALGLRCASSDAMQIRSIISTVLELNDAGPLKSYLSAKDHLLIYPVDSPLAIPEMLMQAVEFQVPVVLISCLSDSVIRHPGSVLVNTNFADLTENLKRILSSAKYDLLKFAEIKGRNDLEAMTLHLKESVKLRQVHVTSIKPSVGGLPKSTGSLSPYLVVLVLPYSEASAKTIVTPLKPRSRVKVASRSAVTVSEENRIDRVRVPVPSDIFTPEWFDQNAPPILLERLQLRNQLLRFMKQKSRLGQLYTETEARGFLAYVAPLLRNEKTTPTELEAHWSSFPR